MRRGKDKGTVSTTVVDVLGRSEEGLENMQIGQETLLRESVTRYATIYTTLV